MALIKDKIIKGVNCPYHKIVDCDVKRGFVGLAHYVSKEAAQVRDNMMGGRDGFQIEFPVDVTNPLSYAYTEIAKSKMSPAEGVEGEEGYVSPAETNWYADAVNDDKPEEVVDGQE